MEMTSVTDPLYVELRTLKEIGRTFKTVTSLCGTYLVQNAKYLSIPMSQDAQDKGQRQDLVNTVMESQVA